MKMACLPLSGLWPNGELSWSGLGWELEMDRWCVHLDFFVRFRRVHERLCCVNPPLLVTPFVVARSMKSKLEAALATERWARNLGIRGKLSFRIRFRNCLEMLCPSLESNFECIRLHVEFVGHGVVHSVLYWGVHSPEPRRSPRARVAVRKSTTNKRRTDRLCNASSADGSLVSGWVHGWGHGRVTESMSQW